MNTPFDTPVGSAEIIARTALGGVGVAARADVVNRTHRVVRQRAQVMQARRSRVRGLMAPLILCSVLLILTAVGVWGGLYQYQAAEAAEAVQANVVTLASDAMNHFLAVVLWFVPVFIALLTSVGIRRMRSGADREAL